MDLIADRFMRVEGQTVADVATARVVSWRPLDALGDPRDERRWRQTCETLVELWHQDLPSLLEFGSLRDGGRFEAFDTVRFGARGAPGSGPVVFLRDAGLGDRAGIEPAGRERGAARRASIGIRLIRRRALDRVAELLDHARNGHPLVVGYIVESGGGLGTFLRAAAREATSRGFVPVSIGAVRRWPALEGQISSRHVLLLARPEDARPGDPERLLTRLALASPRGHVLLRPARRGRDEVRVTLEAFDPETLARALHVQPEGALTPRAIARAADRSRGQPGRFIAVLCGGEAEPKSFLHVAEATPEYRISPAAAPSPDVAVWLQRGDEARRLADGGRYAAARRALMEVSGALRRREQRAHAARCDAVLGRLLLAHGAVEQAETLFRRAHAELEESDGQEAVECAAGVGAALIQKGLLESAEALLRAAREHGKGNAPGVLLARCLGWQARYQEAERALGPALEGSDRLVRAEALVVLGRIALAKDSLPDAGRAGSLALAEVASDQAGEVRAAAHEVLALVQARIADRAAADAHAARALAAARQAHSPLRSIRIRLAQLEIVRRCGGTPERRPIARLQRLARRGLPPLLRARIDVELAQAHPCREARAAHASRADAFIRMSGAAALAGTSAAAHGRSIAQDASAMVGLLAKEPDPHRLLEAVSELLRERLDAASVAVFDVEHRPLVNTGRTATFGATRRALVSRQAIPPYLSENGIEAAAPIEYAGAAVGVLGVRWTIDRQAPATAAATITTGASCAGPAVQALYDRAAIEPRDVPPNGIVGRSPAIARLHQAIRRVGGCPFPVLIEGESGR